MTTLALPAELKPEQITAIIDRQEEIPFDVSPLKSEVAHLVTGDYSVKGLEHVVTVERKNFGDFLKCVGHDRARFDREVMRMLAYPVRALVIEGTWEDAERGQWKNDLTPNQVVGSLVGWIALGLPVIMAGDHARGGKYTARILFTAARRRWRELRSLAREVPI